MTPTTDKPNDTHPLQEAFPEHETYPNYTEYDKYKEKHPPQTIYTTNTCPLHPQINDDLILVKYQLGVRESQNGERKEQINHAWKRINTVGNKAEQEDKTLREDIDDVKEDVNTIKGELNYIGWFVKIVSVAFLIYIAYYILRPELGLV